jgi:hypothetical protein
MITIDIIEEKLKKHPKLKSRFISFMKDENIDNIEFQHFLYMFATPLIKDLKLVYSQFHSFKELYKVFKSVTSGHHISKFNFSTKIQIENFCDNNSIEYQTISSQHDILLVEIKSFNQMKLFDFQEWCITRSEIDYNHYLRNENRQFIVFGWKDDQLFIFGLTTDKDFKRDTHIQASSVNRDDLYYHGKIKSIIFLLDDFFIKNGFYSILNLSPMSRETYTSGSDFDDFVNNPMNILKSSQDYTFYKVKNEDTIINFIKCSRRSWSAASKLEACFVEKKSNKMYFLIFSDFNIYGEKKLQLSTYDGDTFIDLNKKKTIYEASSTKDIIKKLSKKENIKEIVQPYKNKHYDNNITNYLEISFLTLGSFFCIYLVYLFIDKMQPEQSTAFFTGYLVYFTLLSIFKVEKKTDKFKYKTLSILVNLSLISLPFIITALI